MKSEMLMAVNMGATEPMLIQLVILHKNMKKKNSVQVEYTL
jgi:hypothetical protein